MYNVFACKECIRMYSVNSPCNSNVFPCIVYIRVYSIYYPKLTHIAMPKTHSLWERDIIKIDSAMLGGVDTAIRDYIRDGAPTLGISVSDVVSMLPDMAVRDNFAYSPGHKPVLQQRAFGAPSMSDTHPFKDPVVPSFMPIFALEGSSTINATYCRNAMLQLPLSDPATGTAGVPYYHLLTSHLVDAGMVVPTLIRGTPFNPPAYNASLLEQTRFKQESCAAFADDARLTLNGRETFTSRESPRNDGAVEQTFVYTASETPYRSGMECESTAWDETTVVADVETFSRSQCSGGTFLPTIESAKSMEVCLSACLRLPDCVGYSLTNEIKHQARELYGDCTLSLSRCNIAAKRPEDENGGKLLKAIQITVISREKVQKRRHCLADFDFSSPRFDATRHELKLLDEYNASRYDEEWQWPSQAVKAVAESCYACCALKRNEAQLVEGALDHNLLTAMDYYEADGCYVGIDLGDGNAAQVKAIRYAPRMGYGYRMVGGKFQGSNQNMSMDPDDGGFEDIYEITEAPPDGVMTTVLVEQQEQYRWLRYLAPNGSYCSVGEVEFHSARFRAALSPVQSGQWSYWVNDTALAQPEKVHLAELVKCAAHGLLPAWLDNHRQEIVLPEASGHMLTTGSLSDVNVRAGDMSSVSVAGDVSVGGSTVLGGLDDRSRVIVNSKLTGLASVLRFQGDSGVPLRSVENLLAADRAVMDFGILSSPGDKFLQLPDSSGTLVVGELPAVMRGMVMLQDGSLDMTWTVAMGTKSVIASPSPAWPSQIRIHSPVSGSYPLSMQGSGSGAVRVTIAAPEAALDSTVTLPDASGTVLTTGNIPKLLGNITAIRGAKLRGGAAFLDGDVNIGEAGRPVGIDINTRIVGTNSLVFDGNARKDGRILILSAGDSGGMCWSGIWRKSHKLP
jgi:hypothetical protein